MNTPQVVILEDCPCASCGKPCLPLRLYQASLFGLIVGQTAICNACWGRSTSDITFKQSMYDFANEKLTNAAMKRLASALFINIYSLEDAIFLARKDPQPLTHLERALNLSPGTIKRIMHGPVND